MLTDEPIIATLCDNEEEDDLGAADSKVDTNTFSNISKMTKQCHKLGIFLKTT